jgi:sarcosine oxidase delta subunit
MPCRCCGASRPSKGFTEKGEAEINELLKKAAMLILAKDSVEYDGIEEWKKGWQEAFDHHLNGCNEK